MKKDFLPPLSGSAFTYGGGPGLKPGYSRKSIQRNTCARPVICHMDHCTGNPKQEETGSDFFKKKKKGRGRI